MFKKLGVIMLAGSILFSSANLTNVEAASSSQIISTAKNYIGVPYIWGGTTTKGFDCSGFLNFVFEKHGVDLPRTVVEIYKMGTSVSKSQLKEGDIVFFETYKKGASHAGIYIGNNKFIHAGTSSGVSITDLNYSYWKNSYIGAKRILKEETVSKPKLSAGQFYDVKATHWAYNEITYFAKMGYVSGYGDGNFKPDSSITREHAAVVLSKFLKLDTSNKTGNSPFKDVKTANANYGAILAVHKAGIFNGDSNGNFNPNSTFTRAQFAAILDRIYKFETKSTTNFNDVNGHWAESSIKKLASNGVFKGYGDGTFGPNNKTTRGQFVSVLYSVKDSKRN